MDDHDKVCEKILILNKQAKKDQLGAQQILDTIWMGPGAEFMRFSYFKTANVFECVHHPFNATSENYYYYQY